MSYWIKRILLKDGTLITERDLSRDENFFEAPAPVVGDIIEVTYRGRSFPAKVIWGNWPNRGNNRDPSIVVPIRVQEID